MWLRRWSRISTRDIFRCDYACLTTWAHISLLPREYAWVVSLKNCGQLCCQEEYSDKMDILHIGCWNHKLALDDNAEVSAPALKWTLDDVRTTMIDCKSSIKSCSVIIFSKSISCSSVCYRLAWLSDRLNKFISIRNEWKEGTDTDWHNIAIYRINSFRTQCSKLAMQLKEINVVT